MFNLTGYTLLFQYFINSTAAQLVQRLDNKIYNDKDLLEVKVALNMPYLTTEKDFVRFDGTLELNGVQYNYVKRKIAGDTLYLLCLPDFTKTQLYNAKTDIAKAAADVTNSKKNAEASSAKKSAAVNEYNCVTAEINFYSQLVHSCFHNNFISPQIQPVFIKFAAQPPDNAC
jgi:hypothetical protein